MFIGCPLCSHSILGTPDHSICHPDVSSIWEFLEGKDYVFLVSVSEALNRVLSTQRVMNGWMGGMNVPGEMTQEREVPLTLAEWLQPPEISQTVTGMDLFATGLSGPLPQGEGLLLLLGGSKWPA